MKRNIPKNEISNNNMLRVFKINLITIIIYWTADLSKESSYWTNFQMVYFFYISQKNYNKF